VVGVANDLIQLRMRNSCYLALAHCDDAIGQCLEDVGMQVAKIARQMERGNLSVATFENFLPGTQAFQKH